MWGKSSFIIWKGVTESDELIMLLDTVSNSWHIQSVKWIMAFFCSEAGKKGEGWESRTSVHCRFYRSGFKWGINKLVSQQPCTGKSAYKQYVTDNKRLGWCMVTLLLRLLPAEVETSCRKRSLNTLLVTWCTETVSMSPNPALMGDRSGQLETSSSSLLSGWTPITLATRLRGTGAWAQAARRTNA